MPFRVARLSLKSFKKEKYNTKPSSTNDWYTAREKRLKLDNYSCQECGSKDRVQVHHVIAVSRGGSNSINNLITLCNRHHEKKHKHLLKRLQ